MKTANPRRLGITVVAVACLGAVLFWSRQNDDPKFLRAIPNQSLGAGTLPFVSPLLSADERIDEVLNVRWDYRRVLTATRQAEYRVIYQRNFAIAEPTRQGPRLIFIAGSAYFPQRAGSRIENPAGCTVVGIVRKSRPVGSLLRWLGVRRGGNREIIAVAFDPKHSSRWVP